MPGSGVGTPDKILVYYRNRFYDPEHGRWLTRDPMGYADGNSLYEAFGSNPAANLDPMGTDVWVSADVSELTDASGRQWWKIRYTRHRNKFDLGYMGALHQWWWGDWGNENYSDDEILVEYFPYRDDINIWNRVKSEQERLVDDFTANADAKAYRNAIVLSVSAPLQIATAGTAQTFVTAGAAKMGVTSTTALGRVAITATTEALVTGAGEGLGTAVLVPFGEATLEDVGEATARGAVAGGLTGGLGRGIFEASPTLQKIIPDSLAGGRSKAAVETSSLSASGNGPQFRTWNEFQAGTKGQFTSRAEAGQAWTAYKDANGIVTGAARSQAAKRQFLTSLADDYRTASWMRQWLLKGKVPPGYNIDHVIPVSIGGPDIPTNMRLQLEELHRIHHYHYAPWKKPGSQP